MLKTASELKKQAQKIGLQRWNIHNCSMCNYPCGYLINGEDVSYDAGCYCSFQPPHQRDWKKLAQSFNRNQPENNPGFKEKNPEKYKEHYAIWEFTD